MKSVTFTLLALLFTSFLLGQAMVFGQQDPDQQDPMIAGTHRHRGDDQGDEFVRKARIKAEIDTAERANDKMKSESLQLLELAYQVHDTVATKNVITDENLKRLNSIEKLAKGVREKAGGTGEKEEFDKIPAQFDECVKQLNALAEKLNKEVEKTSRFTTSASVIDNSNRILFLVDHMRNQFFHK
ncbi:MAG TPA: hypothetical protein VFC63_15990 [Blastocatellia bacterium]|nr:hypothetical protein [Blastocatellia bacterium]